MDEGLHSDYSRQGFHNKVLKNAFDFAKREPTITHRNQFTTIEPKGWEDEPLLHPADFIAYENYKLACPD
jgi:hypothetical protein